MQHSPDLLDSPHPDIELRRVDRDVIVVRLLSDADLHAAPLLGQALERAIASRAGLIVIDLSGVTFIDSMMLGAILGVTRQTRARGISTCVVVDDPHVLRMFEVTLLDRVLALFSTVELALDDPRSDGLGGGRERVVQRVEDRYQPVESRDLEHPTSRLRRCYEGQRSIRSLRHCAICTDERLESRRVDERALGQNDDDASQVRARVELRHRTSPPSRGRALRRRAAPCARLAVSVVNVRSCVVIVESVDGCT